MTELQAYQLIERYLTGELTDSEVQEFEQKLLSDPILAERAKQYHELTGALDIYGQRTRMKRKLAAIHDQLEKEESPAVPHMQLNRPQQTGGGFTLRQLWSSQAANMAVAASVALVAVLGTLLASGTFTRKAEPQHSHYRELRRDLEKIKRTQHNLMKDINKVEEKVPANPGAFSGTGFAISSDGYIVTSFHVVRDADSLQVESAQGTNYRVEHVYTDTLHDIAILRVIDPEFTSFGKLPYSFKSTQADLGEKVFTLGYPREDVVYGEGALSALSGFEGDANSYQVSIPVNPGNSGGPLLDERGNLIGIISGTQTEAQGAAFAIKSSYLLNLIQSLSKDSLTAPIRISRNNFLAGTPRPQQLKKLRDYVFVVKVFN